MNKKVYTSEIDFLSQNTELNTALPYSEDTSVLRESVKIGNKTVPNRLACQAMEGCDGNADGSPAELTFLIYKRLAEGGSGIIWFEATACREDGRANPRQLWIREDNLDSYKKIVNDIREDSMRTNGYAPLIIMQATHSGRYSKPHGVPEPLIAYNNPIFEGDKPIDKSRILSDDELDRIGEALIESSKLAEEAGFDGVDVKSCHGYLFQELLSAFTRDGRYGGDFENRARLYLDCFRAVRQAIPSNMLLTTRLSVSDMVPKPYGFGTTEQNELDLTEPDRLIGQFVKEGLQILNVTVGNPYYNPHVNRPYRKGGYEPPETAAEGLLRFETIERHIKERFPTLPIVGSGLSYYRAELFDTAERQLREGVCDLVGFGRMWLAYPSFYREHREGRFETRKCCLACSRCTALMRAGQVSGCAVFEPYYKNLYEETVK